MALAFLYVFFLANVVHSTPVGNNFTDIVTVQSVMQPVINCTSPASCSWNGFCVDINTCRCDDGYTTHYNKGNNKDNNNVTKACNYKQKSRLVAFLLQFFLFIVGAGNWYLDNVALAAGQLIYNFGGTMMICWHGILCNMSCI